MSAESSVAGLGVKEFSGSRFLLLLHSSSGRLEKGGATLAASLPCFD